MSRIDVRRSISRTNVSKVSGKLEVLDPEDDVPLKSTGSQKCCACDSQELATKRQPINLQNGKLQVLGPSEDVIIHSAESASRPGSSSRQGSAGRKCYASTKQISLCTVKSIEPSNFPDYNVAALKKSKIDTDPVHKETILLNTASKESTEVHVAPVHNPNTTEQPQESSSDDDDSDNEKPTAPIELLAEFVEALMGADYKLAWKLCQMLLLYEPDNPEAKEFLPLIHKMLQDEVNDEEEDSEDSDEDGDSSDTDDSDSNSTETSESSSEDEAKD